MNDSRRDVAIAKAARDLIAQTGVEWSETEGRAIEGILTTLWDAAVADIRRRYWGRLMVG